MNVFFKFYLTIYFSLLSLQAILVIIIGLSGSGGPDPYLKEVADQFSELMRMVLGAILGTSSVLIHEQYSDSRGKEGR